MDVFDRFHWLYFYKNNSLAMWLNTSSRYLQNMDLQIDCNVKRKWWRIQKTCQKGCITTTTIYHYTVFHGGYPIDIGLYRDDGLSRFQNISGPDSERIKKKMCKIFKENRLNITVSCNLATTHFLDVTFDLKSGTYYPYRKQTNEILNIHKQSNHPPSIIKQIPSMISKQISDISCDSDHFYKAAPDCNTALKKSGFHENRK